MLCLFCSVVGNSMRRNGGKKNEKSIGNWSCSSNGSFYDSTCLPLYTQAKKAEQELQRKILRLALFTSAMKMKAIQPLI